MSFLKKEVQPIFVGGENFNSPLKNVWCKFSRCLKLGGSPVKDKREDRLGEAKGSV